MKDMPEEAMLDLESYNYYSDPRVRAEHVAPPEDGKFHWTLCPLCRGKGTVVNPSLDAGGLDMDGWRGEDPDFVEDYLSGAYDITCPQCLGRTTVAVCDETFADTGEHHE